MRDGRIFFGPEPHAFYKNALLKVPPGLMLDVGAAIGGYSQMMRRHSPQSRVIAFEPFEGNFPHFRKMIGDDPMVSLRTEAVSDESGWASFHVSSTVNATEGFWSNYKGSSSMGALVDTHAANVSTVRTVAIDDIIDETIMFMKVDVQGAEEKVLRGCRRVWETHGVHIMSLEVSGLEKDLMSIVRDRGYAVADTVYNIIPKPDADLSDWDVITRTNLSTGAGVLFAWPKKAPATAEDFMEFLREQREKAGNCWTDVICMSDTAHDWLEPRL